MAWLNLRSLSVFLLIAGISGILGCGGAGSAARALSQGGRAATRVAPVTRLPVSRPAIGPFLDVKPGVRSGVGVIPPASRSRVPVGLADDVARQGGRESTESGFLDNVGTEGLQRGLELAIPSNDDRRRKGP